MWVRALQDLTAAVGLVCLKVRVYILLPLPQMHHLVAYGRFFLCHAAHNISMRMHNSTWLHSFHTSVLHPTIACMLADDNQYHRCCTDAIVCFLNQTLIRLCWHTDKP